jgi:trk system potassium uptake protein TrkA
MLREEGNDITVIDNNTERLQRLSGGLDVRTVEGSPSSTKVLSAAGVRRADLFIAVYPSSMQETNIVGALLAKHMGAAKVIARVNDQEYLSEENKRLFGELGIELLFYPERLAADEILAQLKRASTSETMDFAHGQLQISLFKLDEESPLLDLKLSEFIQQLTPEEQKLFRLIAIARGKNTIIPGPDTVFQYSDLVFTFSRREAVNLLVKFFGQSTLRVEKVMIVGGNEIADMLATDLYEKGITVKLIEIDHDRSMRLAEKLDDNIDVVNGDGRNSDLLYEEGITEFDAFVALTGSDETNVLSCVMAKKLGVPRTVAEVENVEYLRLAEEMGVDSVINKKLITASNIYRFTLGDKARFVKYMRGTNAEVIEYTAAQGSPVTKKALKDIAFPAGAIIGGVIRGEDAFIAVGETQIQPEDRVAVFALPDSAKALDKLFR